MSEAREDHWVPADTFAARLVHLRHDMGLTQEEIADLCGVKRASWNAWEHGVSPRNMAKTVEAIHGGTKARRDWLMWGEVENRDNVRGEGRYRGLPPFRGRRRRHLRVA